MIPAAIPDTEDLIPLHQAPKLPRLLRGQPPDKLISPVTIYRWAKRGVRGVRLAVVTKAGRKKTSREAIDRFLDLVAEGASQPTPAEAPAIAAKRDRQVNRAIQKLSRPGQLVPRHRRQASRR